MKKVLLSCLCLLGLASAAYAGDTYRLVTSLDDVNTTDTYILVCPDQGAAMGTFTDTKKYMEPVMNLTITENSDGTKELTLDGTEGVVPFKLVEGTKAYNNKSTYAFQLSESSYISCTKATSNGSLAESSTNVDNCSVCFDSMNDDCTIKMIFANQNNNGQNVFQYNKSNNQQRFTNYKAGGQQEIALFKKIEEQEPPTPGDELGEVVLSVYNNSEDGIVEVYSGDKLNISCANADYIIVGMPQAITAEEWDMVSEPTDDQLVATMMQGALFAGDHAEITFDANVGSYQLAGAYGVKLKEGESIKNLFADYAEMLGWDDVDHQIADNQMATYQFPEENEQFTFDYIVIQPSDVDFSIADGTEVAKNTTLTLSCEKAQKIRYTINDGEEVEVNGETATVKLTEACTVAAYGVFGNILSETASASYTVTAPSYTMLVAKAGEKYYAMSTNSAKLTDYLGAVEVEVVDGKVQVAPGANINDLLWLVDLPSIVSYDDKNLYYNSGTKLTIDDTNTTDWQELTSNGGLTYIGVNDRAILYNSSYTRFAAYAKSNVGNDSYPIPVSMPYEVAVPTLGEIKFSHDPGEYHSGHTVTISCKNATHLAVSLLKGNLFSGMMLEEGEDGPVGSEPENIVVNGNSYSFTINHREAPHVMVLGVRAYICPDGFDEDNASAVKEYDPFENEDLEDGMHVYSAIIPTNDTFCAGTYTGAEGTPLINVDGSTTHSGNTSEATSLVGRTFYGANVDLAFAFADRSTTYPTSYGDEVRMYSGDSFTVTPDPAYKLLKVVIYTTDSSKSGTMTAKTDDKEVGTVSGDGNGAGTITWTVEKVKEDNKPVTFTAGSSLRFSHIVVTAVDGTTGIEGVAVDGNAAVEYYNLQGVRVENPAAGLYIMRQGSKAVKVLVK